MTVYSADDLDSRLKNLRGRSGRGLAFCVGAGLTSPQVPGVMAALSWMRARFASESDQRSFDGVVANKHGGSAYQAGADFVLGRRGQDDLNELVRAFVLNAHGPTLDRLAQGEITEADLTAEYCAAAEQDQDAWYIPTKVQALAELLVKDSAFAPGPVITTNFDPLLEIAVRRAGGVAVAQTLDADGRLGAIETGGGVLVVHIHGFWRSGDTLHVGPQLTRSRDLVQASLEDLLRERTVLVTAYGGWDDAFTGALVEAVRRHRQGDLDVLWTFFENQDADIQARYPRLLARCESVPGRVSFYRGIDCEILFDQLLRVSSDGGGAESPSELWGSPLEGWTAVTTELLETQTDKLSPDELVRFFDGQIPTWRHAGSDQIPILMSTASVISAIEEARDKPELTVHLVVGPAGEGKSTLARQLGVHFATDPLWRVLWREIGAGAEIDPLAIAQRSWRWLLIADDADTAVTPCFDLVRRLHGEGRSDVGVVLVVRETDWRAVDGPSLPWSQYATVNHHNVRGLSADDALAVVDLWASAGSAGLGNLVDEPDRERRAVALLRAAEDEVSASGSFIGAMLSVRVGQGLDDHVKTLMTRLRERTIRNSSVDLLKAFLYVACLHARNVLTLPADALSGALEIEPTDLYQEVLWPLGDEAAVVQAGAFVVVRHRAIAEVALSLAPDLGEDIGTLYYRVIRAVLRLRQEGQHVTDLSEILYISTRLTDEPAVAIRAARAPVDQEPDRISFRVTLCSVLRQAGRLEEALGEASRTYDARGEMGDSRSELRGLLYEWGVCAGVSGKPVLNVLLGVMSLSDLPNTEPPDDKQRGYVLRGIESPLRRLAQRDPQQMLWREALEAVTFIRESPPGSADSTAATTALSFLANLVPVLVRHAETPCPPSLASSQKAPLMRGLWGLVARD